MGDTTQRWPRGEGNFYPAVREAPRPRPLVDAWPTTPQRDNQPGFDLADTLNALRRRLPTLMATAVIIGLLFAARAARQPATYSAEAEILMGRSVADLVDNTPLSGSTTAERSLQNERRILLGSKITAAATAQLGAPPALDVTAVAGSDVLRVTVTAATPEAAARGANAVVEAYVKDREAQFNDAIAATQARLASLVPAAAVQPGASAPASVVDELQRVLSRLQAAGAAERAAGTLVVTVAEAPKAGDRASTLQNLFLGLVVGSLVGVAVALVREHLDGSVRSVDNLLADTALAGGGVVAVRGADRDQQEQVFNELLLLLAARSFGDRARSIAVLGVARNDRHGAEALSVVVAGLARAIAVTGTSVAVTSAGGHRSNLARYLPLQPLSGDFRGNLADSQRLRAPSGEAGLRRVAGYPDLLFLSSPTGAAGARLAGPARVAVLDGLASKVEIIIVEAGLIDENGGGATGALLVDAALLVVDASVSRSRLRSACSALRMVGANPLAAVLVTGRGSSVRNWAGLFAESGPLTEQAATLQEPTDGTLRSIANLKG